MAETKSSARNVAPEEQVPADTPTHDHGLQLTAEDKAVLAHVDKAYTTGRELKDWWDDISTRKAFTNTFTLIQEFDRPDSNFGYLEKGPAGHCRSQPVMGEAQDLFYDTTKEPNTQTAKRHGAKWMNEQIREFALRYFLRVTSSRTSEAFPEKGDPSRFLRWASQCPKERDERKDIGFYQMAYKLKDGGRIGAFSKAEQQTFVDVREIGNRYDWILAKARIFDFQLSFSPLGPKVPPLVIIDNKEHLYILFTPYFNVDRQNPEEGVLGEYAMGFSIVQPPPANSLFTIGPQVFTMGFNYFKFTVYDTGQVRVQIVFCCNQLDGIFPLPASPIDWALLGADLATFGASSRLLGPLQKQIESLPFNKVTFDPFFGALTALNAVTGGSAGRDYCISKEEVLKFILRKHGFVFNQLIGDSLRVWRQIPDWLDTPNLPSWVTKGEKP